MELALPLPYLIYGHILYAALFSVFGALSYDPRKLCALFGSGQLKVLEPRTHDIFIRLLAQMDFPLHRKLLYRRHAPHCRIVA